MEKPCPPCLTWSHFILEKAEILWTIKYTRNAVYMIFRKTHIFTENNVDPDHLKKPADLDLHCLQYSLYLVPHCFNEYDIVYITFFPHSKV